MNKHSPPKNDRSTVPAGCATYSPKKSVTFSEHVTARSHVTTTTATTTLATTTAKVAAVDSLTNGSKSKFKDHQSKSDRLLQQQQSQTQPQQHHQQNHSLNHPQKQQQQQQQHLSHDHSQGPQHPSKHSSQQSDNRGFLCSLCGEKLVGRPQEYCVDCSAYLRRLGAKR